MSTPDKPDLVRGWLFVEKLLAEEELERIENMSEEELDRELRNLGVRVPSVEELVAGAEARARKKSS
jgi:hypothetical protein